MSDEILKHQAQEMRYILKVRSVTGGLNLLAFQSTNNPQVESTSVKRLHVKDAGKVMMRNLALPVLCRGHSRCLLCSEKHEGLK